MKKPQREAQRRERRETNEANRARNRAVGVLRVALVKTLRVAAVETLPAIREPEIIEARPIRRSESPFGWIDWNLRRLFPWL